MRCTGSIINEYWSQMSSYISKSTTWQYNAALMFTFSSMMLCNLVRQWTVVIITCIHSHLLTVLQMSTLRESVMVQEIHCHVALGLPATKPLAVCMVTVMKGAQIALLKWNYLPTFICQIHWELALCSNSEKHNNHQIAILTLMWYFCASHSSL